MCYPEDVGTDKALQKGGIKDVEPKPNPEVVFTEKLLTGTLKSFTD